MGYGHYAIFPNPTQDYIMIVSSKVIRNIEVYDSNSRLKLVADAGNGIGESNFKLSVSDLAAGIYFLKINGEPSSAKFIKR